jgi:AraC-like DNA-binding protein
MLARYAHRYLDSMMEHRTASAGEKVRELIRVSLSSGRCSTGSIARGLGVDRRTVHRYLSQTGESFSSVLAEVRTEMATRLLRSRRPICSVANLVGFSGTAAFTRWFTQAFGCSPSAWRDAHESSVPGGAAPAPNSFRRRHPGQASAGKATPDSLR